MHMPQHGNHNDPLKSNAWRNMCSSYGLFHISLLCFAIALHCIGFHSSSRCVVPNDCFENLNENWNQMNGMELASDQFGGLLLKFPFAICLCVCWTDGRFCNLVTDAGSPRICAVCRYTHTRNSCDCSLLKVCTLTWLLIVLVEGYTRKKTPVRPTTTTKTTKKKRA